jgi:O-methyltransferase
MTEPQTGTLTPIPGPPSSPDSLEGRYLDLVKRMLSRSGFAEELSPLVPLAPWKRRVWQEVSRLLDRRGVVAFRRAPDVDQLREDGRDWPVNAETMIGLRRLDNLQACVEQVLTDDVPGDLIETGVWRGGASILMRAVLAARGDRSRTVWVADSFQGLPKPSPEHQADLGDTHWTFPQLAVPLHEVRRNFERYGLLDDQVRFLRGWFSETLADAPIESLSLLRVDCDMYGSTMDVLTALYPKLSVGGYLVVDDYGAVPACRTAVEEYRQAQGITEAINEIDWTGVYWRRER